MGPLDSHDGKSGVELTSFGPRGQLDGVGHTPDPVLGQEKKERTDLLFDSEIRLE